MRSSSYIRPQRAPSVAKVETLWLLEMDEDIPRESGSGPVHPPCPMRLPSARLLLRTVYSNFNFPQCFIVKSIYPLFIFFMIAISFPLLNQSLYSDFPSPTLYNTSMINRRREQNKLAQRRFRRKYEADSTQTVIKTLRGSRWVHIRLGVVAGNTIPLSDILYSISYHPNLRLTYGFGHTERYRDSGDGKSVTRQNSQVPLPSIETTPLSRPRPPSSSLSKEIPAPNGSSVHVPVSSSSAFTVSTTASIPTTAMLAPMSSSSHPSSTKSSLPPKYCSDLLLNCLRRIDFTDINNHNNLAGSRSPLELDSMMTTPLSSILTEQPFLHDNIHEHSSHGTQQNLEESAEGGENQGTNTGWSSPLHIAAQKGHDRIIRVLLQHGTESNINLPDSEGRTPLICATIKGCKDVVALLLAGGALLSCVDHSHRSAIHWAVVYRRDSLLKLLLSHRQGEGQTAVRTVIDGYDVNGQTPLHLAIDDDFEDGVRLLLEYGANMNLVARRSSVGA
jgi:ankyrin repeat protein